MSSNFRIKKERKKNNGSSIKDSSTLEKKHKQAVKNIETKKSSICKLRNSLKKTEDELNKLEKMRNNNILIDLEKRANLLNLKEKYTNEINEIESNTNEIDYYDLTGDLINEYYELRKTNSDEKQESKNILDYLNKSQPKTTSKVNRKDLFNDYCKRVDGIKIEKDDGKNRIKYCTECNVEKILDITTSSYICPVCGIMEFVIIDEDKTIKDYSPYQRRNHFKEWLNQFQAKETTEISNDVFEHIIIELSKNRISDYTKLNRCKMQKILKKLGYNKLYEHIPFIINKISGLPAPKITREIEEKFIKMFMQIQEPWDLYKPTGRKNFLSYPYILFKFSELLELDDLLVYFPMLKPTKLMEQDLIWGKFCKHLKWEFYPTT
jgi:hypothetical protein